MTDTTQYDPHTKAQASLAEHIDKMQSVFGELVIKPVIEYNKGYIVGYLAGEEELARLREQVIQQQARIAQMRLAIDAADELAEKHDAELAYGFKRVLATIDDLSALKAHDDALWNEALTTGIEWQATRGHTLDADDYENELRSLKR